MSLMHIPLNSITEQDLRVLVDNKVAETKFIEYKERLPGNSDGDKKEFLADATSFANASGGDIIFGIKESEGVPIEICGLGEINPDREIARLESIMRDGISPRMVGKDIKAIELQNGSTVIIMRISRSWALPHMVIFQKDYRFYTRNANGKHPMDVSEIRAAITLSETIIEKIRNFRLARLSMITSGETPLQFSDYPVIVLHVVPLNAFDPSIQVDLRIVQENAQLLKTIYGGTSSKRYNAEGFFAYDINGDWSNWRICAYTQVFRNGIIESTDTRIFSKEAKLIHSLYLEEKLFRSLKEYLEFLNIVGASAPILIMVSMLRVCGFKMALPPSIYVFDEAVIDRNDLIIPEVLVEKLDVEPEDILKPTLDVIWNAAGLPGSMYYKDGKWDGRR